MGGGDGCRYVGFDVSLGQVMAATRSLKRLFTLILVALVLPNCLVSCVLSFANCVFHFAKSETIYYICFGEISPCLHFGIEILR